MKRKRKMTLKINWPIVIGLAILAVVAAGLYFFKPEKTGERTVTVYFTQGERLVRVQRPLQADQAPLSRALTELLIGPSAAEKARGLQTFIPPGTRALALKVDGETATILFNRKLEAYGGGSSRVEGMIAQIVYTATEAPGIKKAWIRMIGEKELVLGGEGLVIDKPLGRSDLGR